MCFVLFLCILTWNYEQKQIESDDYQNRPNYLKIILFLYAICRLQRNIKRQPISTL